MCTKLSVLRKQRGLQPAKPGKRSIQPCKKGPGRKAPGVKLWNSRYGAVAAAHVNFGYCQYY